MTRKSFAVFGSLSCLIYMGVGQLSLAPQDDPMRLRMNVVLVQLNVAVTDSHGNYVTGLRPQDFSVTEDNIPQNVSTFEESRGYGRDGDGDGPWRTRQCAEIRRVRSMRIPKTTEANMFILFDTSNYMYRSFVFAQDAIADFIRSMDGSSRIAFYPIAAIFSAQRHLFPTRFR